MTNRMHRPRHVLIGVIATTQYGVNYDGHVFIFLLPSQAYRSMTSPSIKLLSRTGANPANHTR
jgi:hypothetical protein